MKATYCKSVISQQVGWNKGVCEPPTKELVLQLKKKAEDGDWQSAVTLFGYSRFSRGPFLQSERETSQLLKETYEEIFK